MENSPVISRIFASPRRISTIALAVVTFLATACAAQTEREKLYIGGIPDQDLSALEARFNGLAAYLTDQLDIPVEYVPATEYAAVVTAFKQGSLDMAWYGGLTGVQARIAVPDARAIAQRPQDQAFQSVFVANPALGIAALRDLSGRSFTFGSPNSTSGHLMPRHFLAEAGLDPERDFSLTSYSGAHDRTWKLVESGAFDAGALNAVVWRNSVAAGEVELTKVDVFWTTPGYPDYHWVIRGDLDAKFGEGTSAKIEEALLRLNAANGGAQADVMNVFHTDRFIPTTNENYEAIEDVARQLGIIDN